MIGVLLAACAGVDRTAPDSAGDPAPVVRVNEVMADYTSPESPRCSGDWAEIVHVSGPPVPIAELWFSEAADGEVLFDAQPLCPGTVSGAPPPETLVAGDHLLIEWRTGFATTPDACAVGGSLNLDNEQLTLMRLEQGEGSPTVSVLDTVSWSDLRFPSSFARTPDGTGAFDLDETPTPGATNDSDGADTEPCTLPTPDTGNDTTGTGTG